MPHFTSDTAAVFGNNRHSMSFRDAAPSRKDAGSISELQGDQPSLNNRDRSSHLDGRDQAQIEATLDALNQPRIEIATVATSVSPEKIDRNGRAMSPEDGFKSRSFEDQGFLGSARERVLKESPVVAELRTNVIIKDEFTLITDMSYHLSTRFSRPESSIMINIDHSACLLLAGSFEPAYILTISAIPCQIQPILNKRNAALVQSFMADLLSVSPERGVLRFVSVPEENLARNGTTVFGEIERIEKQQAEDDGLNPLKRSYTRTSRHSLNGPRRRVSTTLEPSRIPEDVDSPVSPYSPSLASLTPPHGHAAEDRQKTLREFSNAEKRPLNGVLREDHNSPPRRVDSKEDGHNYSAMLKPPPTPNDNQKTLKASKRKSFLSVFKKS